MYSIHAIVSLIFYVILPKILKWEMMDDGREEDSSLPLKHTCKSTRNSATSGTQIPHRALFASSRPMSSAFITKPLYEVCEY